MKRLIMFALVVALMAAAPAYGQNSLKDESGGPAASISTLSRPHDPNSNSNSSPSSSSASSGSGKGSLPFTGFDVMLLAIGGAALVGVGMGVRRLSRPLA